MSFQEDEEVCWICLEGHLQDQPLLSMPCKCPRFAHQKCLMRWQLQSAGSRKETNCEFCDEVLPDWKDVVKKEAESVSRGAKVTTIMKVKFNGVTKGFAVTPGPEGKAKFQRDIQDAFNFPPGMKLNITFTCMEPLESNRTLTLSGENSFDAAVVCASVAAAKRISQTDVHGTTPGSQDSRMSQNSLSSLSPLGKISKKLQWLMSDLSCISVQ